MGVPTRRHDRETGLQRSRLKVTLTPPATGLTEATTETREQTRPERTTEADQLSRTARRTETVALTLPAPKPSADGTLRLYWVVDDGVTRVAKLPYAATGTAPECHSLQVAGPARLQVQRRDPGRGHQPSGEQRRGAAIDEGKRGLQRDQRHRPIHGDPRPAGRDLLAGDVRHSAYSEDVHAACNEVIRRAERPRVRSRDRERPGNEHTFRCLDHEAQLRP
jgi:hypothetical protein